MKIDTVAHQFNLSTSTLRYYEEQGLLGPVHRINGIRDYGQADLDRLDFILCVKRCGMTIREMKHFITIYQQGDATIPERLSILQDQLRASQEQQARLAESMAHLQEKIAAVQALQDASATK